MTDHDERPVPRADIKVFPTWFLVIVAFAVLWFALGAYQYFDVRAARESFEYRQLKASGRD